MNRFEFGAVVASLRQDMRWTQAELAERSGVEISAISNIERGERKGLLKDDVLVKLALALRLTTLERREFLFSASGVGELEVMRQNHEGTRKGIDAKSLLKGVGQHIACITLPVFITDAFCDVLLANHCALEFYQPTRALLATASDEIGGYNELRYVFHADSDFPQQSGDDWERLALISTHHFRRRTLRFRSKLYYASLMKELFNREKYPYFEEFWRRIPFESHDDYSIPMQQPDATNTRAFVEMESLLSLTPYGELYMHQLLPLNKATARRMEKIANKVGNRFAEFAPFPDKRKQ